MPEYFRPQAVSPLGLQSPGAIIREGGVPAGVQHFDRIIAIASGLTPREPEPVEEVPTDATPEPPAEIVAAPPAVATPAAASPLAEAEAPAMPAVCSDTMSPTAAAAAALPAGAGWAAVTARLKALRVDLRETQLRLATAEQVRAVGPTSL